MIAGMLAGTFDPAKHAGTLKLGRHTWLGLRRALPLLDAPEDSLRHLDGRDRSLLQSPGETRGEQYGPVGAQLASPRSMI